MTYNIIYKIVKKSETIYYRGIGKNKGGILKHKSCLLQSDFSIYSMPYCIIIVRVFQFFINLAAHLSIFLFSKN